MRKKHKNTSYTIEKVDNSYYLMLDGKVKGSALSEQALYQRYWQLTGEETKKEDWLDV
jgi:hypothetical protein